MGLFTSKVKLTEEQQKIKEVIELLVNIPETIIDVNPKDMSFLVSNEEHGYYISVDSVGVKISNHNFIVHKRFESSVIDVYKKVIGAEKTKRWKEKEDKIFSNAMELLDKIKLNLQN